MIGRKMMRLVLGGVLAGSSLGLSSYVLAEATLVNAESPARYFINHVEAMAEIEDTLSKHHLIGITGFSGIGKSELVRKFVATHQAKYELVVFIDANTDLIEQYIGAAREVNAKFCKDGSCGVSEDPHKVVESLKSYLKTRKDWLLVFDNLHINENHKIKEFIEWKQEGNIIVCSQDNKYLTQKLLAKTLDEANSNKLTEMLMVGEPSENTRKLVKALREYPTNVLVHSAIYLANNKHISVDEYLSYMKQHNNKVKGFVELIFREINASTKDVLTKMALLNNQKITRNLLELLVEEKEQLRASLAEIIRFGVVEQTSPDRESQVYRMHDSIKEAILAIKGKSAAQATLNTMLTKLDKLIVINKNERLKFLNADSLYNSNLEILLSNADLYQADMLKILPVREKLMWYYSKGTRSPHKEEAMAKWFIEHDKAVMRAYALDSTPATAAIVASYLNYVASYEFYNLGEDYNRTRSYHERAEELVKNMYGYDEIKSYIYASHTLTLIAAGRLNEVEEKLKLAEHFIPKEPKSFIGINMAIGLRARLAYAQGKYQEALTYSNKQMSLDNTFFIKHNRSDAEVNMVAIAPENTRQAMILNALGRYQEAYDLINPLRIAIEKKEGEKKIGTQTLLARVLTQQARAELGIHKSESAKAHINQAIDYLLDTPEKRTQSAQFNSRNVWFGDALVTRGYIKHAHGEYVSALEDFKIARTIYIHAYGLKNVKNFKFIEEMLNQALTTAQAITDPVLRDQWERYYVEQRFRLFRTHSNGGKVVN